MIWRGRNEEDEGTQTAPPSVTEPASVGSRIESVLEAAERAANGIREDAEEWAKRYMEESRRKADEIAAERVKELSELTDNLISRARDVAAQSDELISALDDAGRRLVSRERRDPLEPPEATRPAPRPEPERRPPPPEPTRQPTPGGNNSPVSEGARLLATQMAVAGSSREEIARRLRDEFGIRESNAILDEIGL
jgi:vacuolar-type H+-ATPase subunit H